MPRAVARPQKIVIVHPDSPLSKGRSVGERRWCFRGALSALVLTVLCGCAFSERYWHLREAAEVGTRPRDVPAAQQQAASPSRASAARDIWSGTRALTAEILEEEVQARNPTLAAMKAAWRAAVERYPQVIALDDPQLSYGLAPETIGNRRLDLGQRFELTQKLPWPGKLRTRGEAALLEAEASGEDFESTRLRLVDEVRQTFYEYYFVERAIGINERNKELLRELQRIAETRYAAGLVSKQDALQAEVEREHLVHRGIVLARKRAVIIARLNTFLDLPPESPLPPPLESLPAPAPVPGLVALQTTTLEHRPELRARRFELEAREADVRLAQLEYLPNLTITGIYDTLWQEEELRPMASLGINVPLQLERRRAALDEARARAQRAKSLFEESRAKALFEVSEAFREMAEHEHVVLLYETSLIPASEENLEAARSGYRAATNDFATLIAAERSLDQAELTYQEALAEYHKKRATLERAIGAPLERAPGEER